ncbi:hypothetical protein T08_12201 [Trichinella sp. T8]|nr:hypothetical protein T08_15180 [Trichinella sp. T8]KRZ92283.1 hypothetical protein T08_12201 [Trichinella sp. T8]
MRHPCLAGRPFDGASDLRETVRANFTEVGHLDSIEARCRAKVHQFEVFAHLTVYGSLSRRASEGRGRGQ